MVIGLVACYRPQQFGPPITISELALKRAGAFRVQEAMFWEVLMNGERRDDSPGPNDHLIEARAEGIIDGIHLPIGPGVCAADERELADKLARARFGLQINGAPVDLAPYPIVRVNDRTVGQCGWVGVISTAQRASVNRFVYTVDLAPDGAGREPERTIVHMKVTFKDP